MNVTDGESIAAMLHSVVRTYGGFDVFISNAGVLKAGSVKTQSEKDFDFVTSVNYKGFFLCTPEGQPHTRDPAASVPGVLERHHPDQLQERPARLEQERRLRRRQVRRHRPGRVVRDGTRGRRHQGQRDLPRQLLRWPALERSEERTVRPVPDHRQGSRRQDDRGRTQAFYEAKAPIRRGCTTADVMKAVYYLIDQKYETGQALPVTGGQVMLK